VSLTVCAQCRWLTDEARRLDWWRWTCHHPDAALPEWTNHVTGQTVADPPFQLCRKINTQGNCPLYEASPSSVNPREKA